MALRQFAKAENAGGQKISRQVRVRMPQHLRAGKKKDIEEHREIEQREAGEHGEHGPPIQSRGGVRFFERLGGFVALHGAG